MLRGFNWLWLASDLLYRLIYEVNLQSTGGKIDSMVADRSCCLNKAWKIFMPSPAPTKNTQFHVGGQHALGALMGPELALQVLFLELDKDC